MKNQIKTIFDTTEREFTMPAIAALWPCKRKKPDRGSLQANDSLNEVLS